MVYPWYNKMECLHITQTIKIYPIKARSIYMPRVRPNTGTTTCGHQGTSWVPIHHRKPRIQDVPSRPHTKYIYILLVYIYTAAVSYSAKETTFQADFLDNGGRLQTNAERMCPWKDLNGILIFRTPPSFICVMCAMPPPPIIVSEKLVPEIRLLGVLSCMLCTVSVIDGRICLVYEDRTRIYIR